MPVPVRRIVDGEFVALLTTVNAPETLPVDVGAKPIEMGKLCPGAMLVAPANPLTLKPAPVALTCESVTFPVPLFVRAMACDAALPTSRLPKATLPALGDNKYVTGGAVDAAIPVPDTDTTAAVEARLPLPMPIAMLAATLTAEVGTKTTWNETLRCPPSESGSAGPATTNCELLLDIL